MFDESESEQNLSRAERIFVRISVLQTILALAGLFTGAVALWAALTETDAVRKQQLASVLPDLVFAQSYNESGGEPRFTFLAVNNGIGPARVRAMRVRVDGVAASDWGTMLSALSAGESYRYGQSQIAGRLVRSGELIEVFQSRDPKVVAVILDNRERIDVDVCFCSVFDECWTPTQSVTQLPTPVEQCPDYGAEQFQQ
ncbi:MAG: hypothetical protein AAF184_24645 [Pseudomonadota bacterium]